MLRYENTAPAASIIESQIGESLAIQSGVADRDFSDADNHQEH